MGMAEHFSGVVLVRKEGAKPQVLIQPYLYRGQFQVKFPGGTNEGRPGENPETTACREVLEETSLLLSGRLVLIHEEKIPPNHTKRFYVTNSAVGNMRTKVKLDDGEEDLLPPEWREVNESLVREMFPSHRPALLAAINHMAPKDPDWGWVWLRLAHLF
jgi:8-oxo-dGTP pyrophosphatase MutT (NUDIX family)